MECSCLLCVGNPYQGNTYTANPYQHRPSIQHGQSLHGSIARDNPHGAALPGQEWIQRWAWLLGEALHLGVSLPGFYLLQVMVGFNAQDSFVFSRTLPVCLSSPFFPGRRKTASLLFQLFFHSSIYLFSVPNSVEERRSNNIPDRKNRARTKLIGQGLDHAVFHATFSRGF